MKIVLTILLWVIIVLILAVGVKSIINTIKEKRYRKQHKHQNEEENIIIKERKENE